MGRMILKRLAVIVPTLWIVATLTFLLVQLVPGSPASFILGNNATPESVAKLQKSLGLDRPLLTQYWDWLSHLVFRGSLGISYVSGRSTIHEVITALGPTLSLALFSTAIALVVGLVAGTWIAVRGGWANRVVTFIAGLGLAVPNFVVATVLVYLLAIKLSIFPATGYTSPSVSPWEWIVGLVVPATAIAANTMCQIILQVRANVLEVLTRDFIRTLQAAGVPRWKLLLKHVLRNAAIPVATVTNLTLIYTLSGVVVIETIFNLPGTGYLLLTSVEAHDLPVVQAAVLAFAILVVLVNLGCDLLTSWADPRVRLS